MPQGKAPDPVPTKRWNDRSKERTKRIEPQRPRNVYIKSRPLSALPKGLHIPELHDLIIRQRWLHWALEYGPWTIELALESKRLFEIKIRRIHHSECDMDWEDEVDRLCVGQSTLRDSEIDGIYEYVNTSQQLYNLGTMNCQTIAACLAVVVCDDGFAAWDSIEQHMAFFNPTTGPLIPLTCLRNDSKLSWLDPRLLERGVRFFMRLLEEDEDEQRETAEGNEVWRRELNMELVEAFTKYQQAMLESRQ